MGKTNRQVALAARPSGLPKESDFKLIETEAGTPGPGQFLARSRYLSVDPYMRGRMNDRASYAAPVQLGDPMTGGVVAEVVESNNEKFPIGTIVEGLFGWQDYTISDGKGVRRIDPELAPISTALGLLGMPGLTAYFGLLDICDPQPGETVLVSGAAGAVGSAVGQIAKIKGCKVIGTAGSDEKIKYVTEELGFDAAFNYKGVDNFVKKLREFGPDGYDIHFDNVGGPLSDAFFYVMNIHARISVCGQISQYNLDKAEMAPRMLWKLIEKRAKVQGFLIFDYAAQYREGSRQMAQWYKEGKLKYRETITDGLENAPSAFIGMLTGANIGKQLVKVSS